MQSLWNESDFPPGDDALAQRVYTSRLLGRDPSLVLHGGGNTSVKTAVRNVYGEDEEILYVKGSGWDLATIEASGFAPVKLDALRRMATLETLSDAEMVAMQRSAMIDPAAPNPSVEAILHAVIPFRFVDHTHADAVVTVTNTPSGVEILGKIYGDRVFIVPYVMPGFDLARKVFTMTRDIDWAQIEGLILLHHGVFTFGDDARSSYERMIGIVGEAEDYLDAHAPLEGGEDAWRPRRPDGADPDTLAGLARIRRAVSDVAEKPMIVRINASPGAVAFSNRADAAKLATRGPLTPDHVIRTKRAALRVGDVVEEDVAHYAGRYRAYFDRHTDGSLNCLDAAPRWGVWPGRGVVCMGGDDRAARVVEDIIARTLPAIVRADALGGWEVVDEADLFDVEYWELEQAKLSKVASPPPLAGRIALVTGAASGIGGACVEQLRESGAAVIAVDVRDDVEREFDGDESVLAVCADVTNEEAVRRALEAGVSRFGGLDFLVSNAGVFPASESIADMSDENWRRSMGVNLDAHRLVMQRCLPYLRKGVDPAVVVVGSKNVAAPGRGAGAYSAAKAALAQLCRVAALELAGEGIRVNMVHPNDVFDTGIWSDRVIEERAAHHGMTPEAYRSRNLLGVEITSRDVALMVCAMCGPLFSCTTGAHVPVDGGTERVI